MLISTLFAITAFSILFNACYQVPILAMRLGRIYGSWGYSGVCALRLLFCVRIIGAYTMALPATPCSIWSSNPIIMAVFADCFSRINSCRRIASQYVFSARYFLHVLWINAASILTQVISLSLNKVFDLWVYKQSPRKNVSLNELALIANAPISLVSYVSGPIPAGAKIWMGLWDWAIFINVLPEVLLKGHALWKTRGYVSEFRHKASLLKLSSSFNNYLLVYPANTIALKGAS